MLRLKVRHQRVDVGGGECQRCISRGGDCLPDDERVPAGDGPIEGGIVLADAREVWERVELITLELKSRGHVEQPWEGIEELVKRREQGGR